MRQQRPDSIAKKIDAPFLESQGVFFPVGMQTLENWPDHTIVDQADDSSANDLRRQPEVLNMQNAQSRLSHQSFEGSTRIKPAMRSETDVADEFVPERRNPTHKSDLKTQNAVSR